MSDPAIDAAQRAIGNVQRSEPYRWAEKGAQEALAPLRKLHHREVEYFECSCWYDVRDNSCPRCVNGLYPAYVCAHCKTYEDDYAAPVPWPCPDALHLYSTDELEGTSDAQ
ncbi:hypothetical protein SEA_BENTHERDUNTHAT_78 [Gordonia phage BENtherdunthat]|uniref:Uncharacterized protein n=1 Tax=Gordonia phage BENtherdunthat TaxID=2047830 RepID=A0A2H4PF84_9CAUD|nr:hypothetical protein HOS44_gp078 [Gordonia phage BENtherdunthat]ATW60848.1 hypothetical protein SEA_BENTHERDUNTHAT_78 [Gordonia phage BENtherdunthat]